MDELKERLHEFIFTSCVTASEGMIDEAVAEFFHYLEINGYVLAKHVPQSVTAQMRSDEPPHEAPTIREDIKRMWPSLKAGMAYPREH